MTERNLSWIYELEQGAKKKRREEALETMRRGKEDPEFQQDAQESSLEANF